MPVTKCKKSLFCVRFLFFFFLGTICGVLLFRCLAAAEGDWILRYSQALFRAEQSGLWSALFSAIRPVLLAALMGIVPWGRRFLPVLIVGRGMLMAYAAAACFVCGVQPGWLILRGLALLPVFYTVCRWTFGAFPLVGAERKKVARTVRCGRY